MRKTPLKKRSKDPVKKLQKECDVLYQLLGKAKWPKSIISGLQTQVIHHFYPKSVSNALRYDFDNGVPLTNGEHMRHHQAGDASIHGEVIRTRGLAWYEKLTERRWKESVKTNKAYYEEIKEKLTPKFTVSQYKNRKPVVKYY